MDSLKFRIGDRVRVKGEDALWIVDKIHVGQGIQTYLHSGSYKCGYIGTADELELCNESSHVDEYTCDFCDIVHRHDKHVVGRELHTRCVVTEQLQRQHESNTIRDNNLTIQELLKVVDSLQERVIQLELAVTHAPGNQLYEEGKKDFESHQQN